MIVPDRIISHRPRRRWLMGAAVLFVLALVAGLTVHLLEQGDARNQLIAEATADLDGWQGVSYRGVVTDTNGVSTAVTLTVTRDGAAHGTLTRDFGAQAEIAVDGSGSVIKGNRQFWLWEKHDFADELADTWIDNPPDDATGLVPVALLTPSSLSREVSTSATGTWTQIGEQTVAGQPGLLLSDGTRQAVVTAATPHRLLSIALPISVPSPPAPHAHLTQGDEPRAQQRPTATFEITEPIEKDRNNTVGAVIAIKKAIRESGQSGPKPLSELTAVPPNVDRALVDRLVRRGIDTKDAATAGQYGMPLLQVMDALTSDITVATDPDAPHKVKDAAVVLHNAVLNHEFAVLYQLVTSGKLDNPADLKRFMANIDEIGNKRQLEEAARRTWDGHDLVVDGDYTPVGAGQPVDAQQPTNAKPPYKADILDLTTREATQIKTVTTQDTAEVQGNFKKAVDQLSGITGQRPPPGFTRVVQLNFEFGAAHGMGVMDPKDLLEKLRTLDLYAECFVGRTLVADKIVITNFAGATSGSSTTITRFELDPKDLRPAPKGGVGAAPAPQPPKPQPPAPAPTHSPDAGAVSNSQQNAGRLVLYLAIAVLGGVLIVGRVCRSHRR
ncbi:MAG TPA: hypothetical protein VGJ13_17685 [Pseudonocardiaceae bacterium]